MSRGAEQPIYAVGWDCAGFGDWCARPERTRPAADIQPQPGTADVADVTKVAAIYQRLCRCNG